MSIRPNSRKRSVVQVLSDGMRSNPPARFTRDDLPSSDTVWDIPEWRGVPQPVLLADSLLDAVVAHLNANGGIPAEVLENPEKSEKSSCCEEAQLTANELARRNEELTEAEVEIAAQKERAEKAEAERDEAWKEAEVWRKLWAKVANRFIAGTNEQQIERERDAWRKNAKTANDEAMAERDRAVRAEAERDEWKRTAANALQERDLSWKGEARLIAERDELQAKLDAAENRPTLDREAVRKVVGKHWVPGGGYYMDLLVNDLMALSLPERSTLDREAVESAIEGAWEMNGRGELDVFNEYAAADAIMALVPAAESWPEWLGPKVDPDECDLDSKIIAPGYGVKELRERVRYFAQKAGEAEAAARRREAMERDREQAATGDEDQRVEEAERELAHKIHLAAPDPDDVLDETTLRQFSREAVRIARDAGWTPPESEA